MKFSLILATIGRTTELAEFLESLLHQGDCNLEVIIVDQNTDNRLEAVIEPYRNRIPLSHVKAERGISKARNIGLSRATGDVIAFPDDDCWYPEGLISRVTTLLGQNPDWGGVTGRTADNDGLSTFSRFDADSGPLNRFNVWTRGVSVTVFLRKDAVHSVGGFDEDLGAGAETKWQSGEETDYLLRILEHGYRLEYRTDIVVGHPNPDTTMDEKQLNRAQRYAPGMGRVLRKHNYPIWFSAKYFVRPLLACCMYASRGQGLRARFYWALLRGRLAGWRAGE